MIDRQAIYDKVRAHLLAQDEQALDYAAIHAQCAYRIERFDGTVLRCSIGCLIPDEHYRPSIEGSSLDTDTLTRVIEASIPGYDRYSEDRSLLEDLQTIHDGNEPILWRGELDDLAHRYNLTVKDDA